MKKLVTVVLLFALLMLLPMSQIVFAQEPVVEPTVEPVVEPVEEPTVEPVVEPTAEPVVEPAVEPVVEPVVEPTIEPTVEPVAETTEGEINAAVIPGSWSSEYIGIQNVGTGTANVSLALYLQGSSTAAQTIARDVPQSGMVTLSSNNITTQGAYAGIVSSNLPVAVAVMNTNYTGKAGDAYLGESAPSAKKVLPIIYRGHANFWTYFHIQNVENADQTVTVKTYHVGSSTPSPAAGVTYSVKANSSLTVDFYNDTQFASFGAGSGHYGYATVEAASGQRIAVVAQHDKQTTKYATFMHTGFDQVAAGQGRTYGTATLYKGHAGFNSGIGIINLGAVQTTITISYTVTGGTGATGANAPGTVHVYQTTIGANQLGGPNLPEVAAFPANTYGGASFSSNLADVIGYVTSVNYVARGAAFSAPTLNPADATSRFAMPLAFKPSGSNEWNTGLGAFAVGANATCNVTWVAANTNPPTTYASSFTVNANSIGGSSASELAVLPTGFVGGAIVDCGSVPVIGYANTTRYSQEFGTQMPAYSY